MKKPRRRRLTSKRSLQAKLRRNMFVIVVILLLGGWAITAAVTWSGFRPQRVNITGTQRVDPALIRASAHISTANNIWLINPWGLSARLAAIPYVLSVDLRRSLPNRVTLVVHERRPDSCVVWHNGIVTIDATQRILQNGCSLGMRYILPNLKSARIGSTIADHGLSRLHDDVAVLGAQHLAALSATFDRDNGVVIVTRNGVTLLLGEDSAIAQTSALLPPIFAAVKKQGRTISRVDLRAPTTPVVRYKESSDKTEKSANGA